MLEALRDILDLAGYGVLTARNGVEALTVLSQQVPSLIVSDIQMPRMDGYQLFGELRANPDWVRVPFIFLSAKGQKADVRRGKLLGADDYITKPFEEADLLIAVQAKLNRRAELEAAHTRQMGDLKRTILTTLNHEFRTPLTYISTYADMLRDTDFSADEFKDFMRGIQLGSDRLRRLVEDFIFLVELQTGEAEATFARRSLPVGDLPLLVSVAVERTRPRAEARQVELEEDTQRPLPVVHADREYLLDALLRLLDNAVKFSKKGGGHVIVRAEPGGRGVRLSVIDDGVGMPAEALDRIFDVFYQIDRAKNEQQGSGSGLAIALGLARLHGGTVTAESALGQGSTFTLDLPAVEPSPAD